MRYERPLISMWIISAMRPSLLRENSLKKRKCYRRGGFTISGLLIKSTAFLPHHGNHSRSLRNGWLRWSPCQRYLSVIIIGIMFLFRKSEKNSSRGRKRKAQRHRICHRWETHHRSLNRARSERQIMSGHRDIDHSRQHYACPLPLMPIFMKRKEKPMKSGWNESRTNQW